MNFNDYIPMKGYEEIKKNLYQHINATIDDFV